MVTIESVDIPAQPRNIKWLAGGSSSGSGSSVNVTVNEGSSGSGISSPFDGMTIKRYDDTIYTLA
jgi:hypothetical protein